MEQGRLRYIDRNSEGITFIEYKEFECKLEQLDRIEEKLDSILKNLDKELSNIKI